MNIDPEDLGRFFKTHNSRFDKCLEPTMLCEKSAIRAHSIQNSRVIDLLAKDGHVVALRPTFSSSGPAIEFKHVGRNNASTFTGLCSEHDARLFAPLDTKPFDIEDREQLFLLAYRSVTRELHAVMEGAIKIQSSYLSRVGRGVDPENEISPAGVFATQHLINSYETYQYRAKHFDNALLARRFNAVEHDIIVFDNQPPCIAVSSLFSLDEIEKDDDIVRAILNVFPTSTDRTIVVFSYVEEDKGKARAALSRVLSSGFALQKYEMSKLILSRIENFLISPPHYQAWGQEKVDRIKNAFVQTGMAMRELQEHPDLMLF